MDAFPIQLPKALAHSVPLIIALPIVIMFNRKMHHFLLVYRQLTMNFQFRLG
jgi:hypothetical protein